MIVQFILNGLITGVLYALLAIGFALVYNTTKIFHIAAAGIWSFATYLYYMFSNPLDLSPAVSVCVAMIICVAINLLIDFVVYRPLYRKNASTGVLMIASIGVLTIIGSLSAISSTLAGWTTMSPKANDLSLFVKVCGSAIDLAPLLIGFFVILVFVLTLKFSVFGSRLRAMESDVELYSSLGFEPMKMRTIAFLLSGLFIALSSCLLVGKGGSVVMDNSNGLDYFVYALAAMIVGGMGNFGGCVVGGLMVGIIEEVIKGYGGSPWIGLIVFGSMILTLLFRPQGIMGQKKREI